MIAESNSFVMSWGVVKRVEFWGVVVMLLGSCRDVIEVKECLINLVFFNQGCLLSSVTASMDFFVSCQPQ